MLRQCISLALLWELGLVSALPAEKRQELGEGGTSVVDPNEPYIGFEDGDIIGSGGTDPIDFSVEDDGPFSHIAKRAVNISTHSLFGECAAIDLEGVETAYSILVDAYGSPPDSFGYIAMQPLHDIIRGYGVSAVRKRAVLSAPTGTAPFDTTPLEEVLAELEATLGEAMSLVEVITIDSIHGTIEMSKGSIPKRRWSKRATAVIDCSTERINAWRLGLYVISTMYGDSVPEAVWLIAENCAVMLESCGQKTDLDAVFSIGTPVAGSLETDPTVSGGEIEPDGPVDGGSMIPDETVSGGEMSPDPVVSGTITPRTVKCNKPIYEAMVTLEATYGRACGGRIRPSILMAQLALVMIIFRGCRDVWDNWEIVELSCGFIEIGPIYCSSGVNPSD
ncbi:hypothetical protein MKZ38_001699 [Zalerion maritima]|uniref:Uncharacterized protein n=1 Tax=Zalerion maritima TaxID=339359 RepID=A0AAD5RPX9_9PEZI|nr:hypothetical protein MKZ38_001699 [Zalerion maritima]